MHVLLLGLFFDGINGIYGILKHFVIP